MGRSRHLLQPGVGPFPGTHGRPAGAPVPSAGPRRVLGDYAGCYDVTPDFNPIISVVDGLVVAAGFSGHGYKISPAVGDLVADLVTEGTSTDPQIPSADFRLDRFAEGKPLSSRHPYVGAGEMR